MALQRSDTTLVQPVVAQYDDIKGFTVDVFNYTIHIVVSHGNYDEDKNFIEVSSETITIRDAEFLELAFKPANLHETIFGNLKGLLWGALLVRGIVKGEIV